MTTTDPEVRTRTVHIHRVYIKATPQAVWDAIIDPEWNGRYGYRAPAEYDLRPGGAYRVSTTAEMRERGAPDLLIDGEVLEIDPPRRLVQTWHANFTADTAAEAPGRVTWEIEEDDGGLTRLTVVHELEDAPHTLAAVANDERLHLGGGGWNWILSDLKSLLETGSSIGG
jgi:uncharacterized protein YndB with AHSA1/START domain